MQIVKSAPARAWAQRAGPEKVHAVVGIGVPALLLGIAMVILGKLTGGALGL